MVRVKEEASRTRHTSKLSRKRSEMGAEIVNDYTVVRFIGQGGCAARCGGRGSWG